MTGNCFLNLLYQCLQTLIENEITEQVLMYFLQFDRALSKVVEHF